MSRSLPSRPNLRYLKDEAKRRVRSGEFATLAQAQYAIAREFGFASWPRLSAFVVAITADLEDRAALLVRSACSRDVRLAGELLSAQPDLSRYDLATACATGDAEFVARRISARPDTPFGPLSWPPILYACFSRFLRTDPVRAPGIREVVRILLAAGASPNYEGLVPLYGAAGSTRIRR